MITFQMSRQNRILVVDDDPDILDALQFMLHDAGYAVETTERGEDAERLTTKNLPDLIVLDVLLSGSDGRIICRKLKDNTFTKNIPIVMISAHPDAKQTVKIAGADDFLSKPFDVDELLRIVKKHLDKSS